VYTDEDLNEAVAQGTLTAAAVANFRDLHAQKKNAAADEEYFRLITGFNDVFIVVICLLLLLSCWWLLTTQWGWIPGSLTVAVFSWGLAEFFVIKKRMALPAIVLLLSYLVSVFMLTLYLSFRVFNAINNDIPIMATLDNAVFGDSIAGLDGYVVLPAAIATVAAAYAHWCRFKVPVTVAGGIVALLIVLMAFVFIAFPDWGEDVFLFLVFIYGVAVFVLAMCWDASDLRRQTRRADVAFWLHLLSAPLVVFPIFSKWMQESDVGVESTVGVVLLYLLMIYISLIVDRRVLILSSLVYVLYALSDLFAYYGKFEGDSAAFIGVLVGGILLLLSVFWRDARRGALFLTPAFVKRYVPAVKQGNGGKKA